MNGTLAVLTFIFGLVDASRNYCGQEGGCFAPGEAQGFMSLSYGAVYFQNEGIGQEIYLRRDTRLMQGPFQMIYGFSATSSEDFWIGLGHSYEVPLGLDNLFVELHAMTGFYANGGGPDLGGPIEFRSGIEIGYEADNGIRIGLLFDHRSNAGIYDLNPGLETLQLRVSIPLK